MASAESFFGLSSSELPTSFPLGQPIHLVETYICIILEREFLAAKSITVTFESEKQRKFLKNYFLGNFSSGLLQTLFLPIISDAYPVFAKSVSTRILETQAWIILDREFESKSRQDYVRFGKYAKKVETLFSGQLLSSTQTRYSTAHEIIQS